MIIKKWLRVIGMTVVGTALLISGAYIHHMINSPLETRLNAEDHAAIVKALIRVADTPIADVACEVNGTTANRNGTSDYNKVTVGDFIASFIGWSFKPGRSAFQGLECDGTGTLHCRWSFGQHKTSEGWSRLLEFAYDPGKKQIDATVILNLFQNI